MPVRTQRKKRRSRRSNCGDWGGGGGGVRVLAQPDKQYPCARYLNAFIERNCSLLLFCEKLNEAFLDTRNLHFFLLMEDDFSSFMCLVGYERTQKWPKGANFVSFVRQGKNGRPPQKTETDVT